MKRNKSLHVVLAGIGCASLLVYILACSTSFSPDDSQVLYPAFDAQSGAVSVAVYDRKTGRSENIFTAIAPSEEITNQIRLLTRAQWLPDGKHVLIAHVPPDKDKGLSFFIVPRGVQEPVRHLAGLNIEEPAGVLEFPFCVVGSRILVRDEDTLGSIDYRTGQIHSISNANNVALLPGGDDRVIGAAAKLDDDERMAFGTVDPQTLAFTPIMTCTNKFEEAIFPAFDVRGRRAIVVSGEDTNLTLQIVKSEGVEFSRPIERGGAKLMMGPWLDLGPRGDRVYTAYISRVGDAEDAEYGVVEIPLNRGALRWIPLFHAKPDGKGELIYAQASLSHDGQTWAMATSYLYLQNTSLKAEDCALFLVEVGQARPKITKVPIAPPLHRAELIK